MKSFAEYEEQKAADNLARVMVDCNVDPVEFCDDVLEYFVLNESMPINELLAGLGGAAGQMWNKVKQGVSQMGQAYSSGEGQAKYNKANQMITQLRDNLKQLGVVETKPMGTAFDNLSAGLQQAVSSMQGDSAMQAKQAFPSKYQGQFVTPEVVPDQQPQQQPDPNAQLQPNPQQHQQSVGQQNTLASGVPNLKNPLDPKNFQPQNVGIR